MAIIDNRGPKVDYDKVNYASESDVARIYSIGAKLRARLGEPDIISNNVKNHIYELRLYSRARLEKFIEDNPIDYILQPDVMGTEDDKKIVSAMSFAYTAPIIIKGELQKIIREYSSNYTTDMMIFEIREHHTNYEELISEIHIKIKLYKFCRDIIKKRFNQHIIDAIRRYNDDIKS